MRPTQLPRRVHLAPGRPVGVLGVYRAPKGRCGTRPSPPDHDVLVTEDESLVTCARCLRWLRAQGATPYPQADLFGPTKERP